MLTLDPLSGVRFGFALHALATCYHHLHLHPHHPSSSTGFALYSKPRSKGNQRYNSVLPANSTANSKQFWGEFCAKRLKTSALSQAQFADTTLLLFTGIEGDMSKSDRGPGEVDPLFAGRVRDRRASMSGSLQGQTSGYVQSDKVTRSMTLRASSAGGTYAGDGEGVTSSRRAATTSTSHPSRTHIFNVSIPTTATTYHDQAHHC